MKTSCLLIGALSLILIGTLINNHKQIALMVGLGKLTPSDIYQNLPQYKSDLVEYLTLNSWTCGYQSVNYDPSNPDECSIAKDRPSVDVCKYGNVRFSAPAIQNDGKGLFYPRAMKSQMVRWTWSLYDDDRIRNRYVAFIGERDNFWVLTPDSIQYANSSMTWVKEYTNEKLVCKIL